MVYVYEDQDVTDTPYRAHHVGNNLWAIYCSRHHIVFPVEITEEGPLHAVPWNPVNTDDLTNQERQDLRQYAAYRRARVVESGCSH